MVLNPIQDLCSNDDYVKKEIIAARKLMGLKKTNIDSVIFALGLLYLYCNKPMMDIVYTNLTEAVRRKEISGINGGLK